MTKHIFTYTEKVALWNSYGKKCVYTGDPLPFQDLEIDHIIPESILQRPGELKRLTNSLGLGKNFSINSFSNWIPVHHRKNRIKNTKLFSDQGLHFYLEIAKSKIHIIQKEFERLRKQAINEEALFTLATRIEEGLISKTEAIEFIQGTSPKSKVLISDPIVICFGLNIFDVIEKGNIPKKVSKDYISICDRLEKELLKKAQKIKNVVAKQTEASARNGETLSVRIAFWYLNLDKLTTEFFVPWNILEVAMYSDIYGELPES